MLEITELIERGTGRRQQHYRVRCGAVARVLVSGTHRVFKITRPDQRNAAGKRCLKFGSGTANQIGFADAWEISRQAGNAAFLGKAANDPEDVGKTCQGARRRISIGGFRIIDEAYFAE